MDPKKALEALKMISKTNKAASDLFHDFALRERTRGQLTVRAVSLRMQKQGFKHESKEYADVLKALADCGFGQIKTNRRGNVVGLFGIKATLQSIGQAVVGKGARLQNYAPRNKYSPIPVSQAPKEEVIQALSSVDRLVRSILEDGTIPAERRIEAARALMKETTR